MASSGTYMHGIYPYLYTYLQITPIIVEGLWSRRVKGNGFSNKAVNCSLRWL